MNREAEALTIWVGRIFAICLLVLAIAIPAGAYLWARGSSQSAIAGQRTVPTSLPPRHLVARLQHLGFNDSIPILTYHNIERSSSRYAVSPEAFSSQMALLDAAGYETISTDQFLAFLAGEPVDLPSRPILITFDDGPKSVWINADPVLERHGFRAVMFIITGRVGQHQPYYLNWPEIVHMAETGRWNFESHTKFGHRRIATASETPASVPFLTNRMWLQGKERLETIDEYSRRVLGDLRASVRDLTSHGLPRPRMFAFPFSSSSFPTNDRRIPNLLERLVRSQFEAVMDNVDAPTFVSQSVSNDYLPRIEIFNDTTLSRFAAELSDAQERTVNSFPLPLGNESIYTTLNEGDLRTADLMLHDIWALPRFAPASLGWPLSWHEDPFGERYWRFLFYSLRPTSNLLWAYYATEDTRYLDKLLAILKSFARHDRHAEFSRERFDDRHGAAFRAMVLTNTYWKLQRSGDLPSDLAADLRTAIRRLGMFLQDPDNFQGDHNHGFAQIAALLLIAERFPDLDGASSWREVALDRLRRILVRTIGDDGVEVENSPYYHFYVLTALLELDSWAKRAGFQLPTIVEATIASMIPYAAYVTQPNGTIPLVGASLPLDVRRLRPDLYAALADASPTFAYIRSEGSRGAPPTRRLILFPDSGQAVLRSRFGSHATARRDTHVLFDVGPWRTAHSQLDALNLTLYSDGEELIVDSGLYRYEQYGNIDEGGSAGYFWSTRAHNTVVVDGRDQSIGDARPGLSAVGSGWVYQSGLHDLYPGVGHRRSVLVLAQDVVLVIDRLESTTTHTYEQLWHVAPSLNVSVTNQTALASERNGTPILAIHTSSAAPLSVAIHRGENEPMQGWYSDAYGRKEANAVVGYMTSGASLRFVTVLASGPRAQDPVHAKSTGSAIAVDVGSESWLVAVHGVGSQHEEVSVLKT